MRELRWVWFEPIWCEVYDTSVLGLQLFSVFAFLNVIAFDSFQQRLRCFHGILFLLNTRNAALQQIRCPWRPPSPRLRVELGEVSSTVIVYITTILRVSSTSKKVEFRLSYAEDSQAPTRIYCPGV